MTDAVSGGTGREVTVPLADIRSVDRPHVGTKAATLGELRAAGHLVPDGFVVTVDAFRRWRRSGGGAMPVDVDLAVRRACSSLGAAGEAVPVAVRSSAIDEDLSSTSFAGVYDSYPDTVGAEAVVARVVDCWSSSTSSRVATYRSALDPEAGPDADDHLDGAGAAMAVLVQLMAPADRAGVALGDDPRRPGSGRIVIEAVRGRGTAVVGGAVAPDRYVVDVGTGLVSVESGEPSTGRVLADVDVLGIADVVGRISRERGAAQDVEFAVGSDGRIWILQARPLTHRVVVASSSPAAGDDVLGGVGASSGVATGAVRILHSSSDAADLLDGEVLVAPTTDPGWIVAMRAAAAIVTDLGGVTSHAAIVSRELGLPCVVGTGTATSDLVDGEVVTVDGTAGTVTRASTSA